MKNNEIMISVQFNFPNDSNKYSEKFSGITDSLAFLVKDDITLKAFIEGLYYGLHNNFPEHFILFKDYLKHRKQFVVDYSRKGKFKVINFEEELLSNKVTLIELGFVTSSVLLITMKRKLESQLLFDKIPSSYILDSDDNPLEYNISSRTLEAVDSSDIEILPPGDIPEKDERTLADILIPTVLSTGGMIGVRAVMSKSASSSGMGGMMWMMTAATGVMTLVTSTYNYFKQGATNTKKKTEWKENYEKYIKRLIDEKIGIWQKADLTYLQSLYPDMLKLFTQLSTLDSAIFSRSQNDNDFMRITLGVTFGICIGCCLSLLLISGVYRAVGARIAKNNWNNLISEINNHIEQGDSAYQTTKQGELSKIALERMELATGAQELEVCDETFVFLCD